MLEVFIMSEILEKIKKVNDRLLKGEPGNISVDSYSGYTGYKPQCLIDALNAEMLGMWGFSELSSEVVTSGDGLIAISNVEVWLEGIDWHPSSWGQARSKSDIGDAKKGAQTDAIKKGFSYFSVGARAFHGLLQKGASGK